MLKCSHCLEEIRNNRAELSKVYEKYLGDHSAEVTEYAAVFCSFTCLKLELETNSDLRRH